MGIRTRTIAAQVANTFSNATNTQTLTPTANVTFESLSSNTLSVTTITSSGLATSLSTAYSNAIAYSGNAALAYANAVVYAASNTYVNTQLGLKASLAGAAFTGAVSGITTLAAGNTTITGSANVSTTFQVGANVVLGTTTISANGGVGSAGQVLTSGSTGNVYWSTVATTLDAVLGIGNTTSKALTTGTLTVNGVIKTTGAFIENATAITADYSISANSNAMTAGPISISNPATVTIPSDSNWIIL